MSETATANPTAEAKSAAPEAPVSFADALDVGIESVLKTPSTPTEPVQTTTAPTPEVTKTVVETTAKTDSLSPLDTITKRLTGQDKVETKSEASDDLDIKTPDNLKPEAQTAWARLTKDLRDTRAKLKEMESKISQSTENSVEQIDFKNQLEQLKAERDEYESELKLSRLESTREYKQAVTEPLNNIQQEVTDIAKMYDADPRLLYSAMLEPDPAKRREAMKQLTGNFDAVDALALRTKAEDLQRVFARREILTKDVNTVMQMIEAQEKEEMEAYQRNMIEQTNQAYNSEWENFQKENPLLQPIKDNEAWNNTVQSIQKQALDIENSELDPRTKARLTFNAAAMPVVMNVFQDYVSKAQARIAELEKLTNELRAVSPSAGAGTNAAPEIPSDLSFVEALERGLKR
jgi:hypothetical protein